MSTRRAALLENDVALGLHVILGETQILHAVGFHPHDERQPVAGHTLEIGGDIVIGEGVVLAAVLGDDLGELPGRDLVGALEHQMFEEVGDARGTRRLVGGADLVPDHLRHDRRAMIRDHQHLQAVLEGELADPLHGLRAVRGDGHGKGGKAQRGKHNARARVQRGEKLIDHP